MKRHRKQLPGPAEIGYTVRVTGTGKENPHAYKLLLDLARARVETWRNKNTLPSTGA